MKDICKNCGKKIEFTPEWYPQLWYHHWEFGRMCYRDLLLVAEPAAGCIVIKAEEEEI